MTTALNRSLRTLAVLTLGILLAAPAWAQTLKAVRVTAGLSSPLYACAAPGDTTRIFIVQQGGLIRIFKNGSLLATPFINLGTKILTGSEQGLLGMAFHPNYSSNGFFYVSYTRAGDGASIVERYSVSGNPDIATPASGLVIVGPVAQPESNHNGGCIQFGGDGMLYFALGDGGGANDQHGSIGNGQSGTTMLGKMLRFDVNIAAPYIPPTNPFVGNPNVRDEVWDLGLRNPWRFSFDRVLGDMFIGDVGQDSREEVNFEPAGGGGRNFGWRCMEGLICTGMSGCTCNAPTLTLPIDSYSHSFGCTVIGGYIYRGCAMPSLHGTYFYADYCSARIWSFTYDSSTSTKGATIERTAQLAPGGGLSINSITSFGEDGFGEILIVDQGGELFRIISATQVDCNANNVEDACDVSSGNSLDINSNGIPDECDCAAPVSYCVAKFNSLGCLPSIHGTGLPSASLGFGFVITGTQVLNQKVGFGLYTISGRAAVPFSGGTLCLAPAVRRTTAVSSGGSPPGFDDCSGVYSIDFNAFTVGALGGTPAPELQNPGQMINAQYWGRDPGFPPPNNTTLTNGLEFTQCP